MTPNLEISTVIGCKMNCDYCPQKVHVTGYQGPAVMTFADFKRMLSTVPKEVEIVFAGMAEPWLNKWCTDMVCHAFDKGYKVGVYSTCVGMRQIDVDRIASLPFIYFTIHLPDVGGRMHLKITDHYLDMLSLVIMKIPHNFMVIGDVHPRVKEVTGHVQDGSAGLLSRAGNLKHLAINPKKGPLSCSACGPKIDHNILLPNGDVLLCCMDYGRDHVLGNLLEMEYNDLFKSKEYARIMAGLKDESIDILCRKCEISA